MTTEHTAAPAHSIEQPPIERHLWWAQPAAVVVGLSAFALYALVVVALGTSFHHEPYLSPFYSPLVQIGWWPLSPAFLVMWIPLGFRLTCYYYRKAYYRAFFWDPPACGIRERGLVRMPYRGERRFPNVLLNSHRYWLYLSILILAFLWWDTILGFNFGGSFGIGLGSLILLANVVLLTAYTGTCHSLRHLTGGELDCFSCDAPSRARRSIWERLSALNPQHGLFAWLSLFSLLAADLYIKLLIAGVISDPRIL